MHPDSTNPCAHSRRGFLLASATLGASLLLPNAARAAQIKRLEGQVTINGKQAKASTRIKAGDVIVTGAGAKLVFAVGQDAFLLRGGSRLKLDASGAGKDGVVSGLRLLTGALVAVLGKGARRIETTTATAGIRGTGVYIESSAEQTYFCTCYGEVELRSRTGNAHKLVVSGYHTPTVIYAQMTDGTIMTGAPFKDHTDAELIMLSRLLGQPSPIEERDKQVKDSGQGQTQDTANPAPQQSQATEPQQPSQAPKEVKPVPEPKRPSAKQSDAKQAPAKQSTPKQPPAKQTAKKAPPAEQAPAPQPEPTPGSQAQQTPTPPQPVPEPTLASPPAAATEPTEVRRELPPATLESPLPPRTPR